MGKFKYLVHISCIGESFLLWKTGGFSYNSTESQITMKQCFKIRNVPVIFFWGHPQGAKMFIQHISKSLASLAHSNSVS